MIVGPRRALRAQRRALDAVAALVGLLWLLPLLTMLLTAIKPDAEIYAPHFSWLPARPTLLHFAKAWQAAPFARYTLNSLGVAAATTALTLLVASLAAFALCRLRFPGRLLILGGMLSTTMIPFQAVLIPFFILLTRLHLVNARPGLVVAYLAIFLPFATFMLVSFMRSLPREVEDSARIDGCSWFGVWWRIALPMSRPALAAVGIYTFIESWKEFLVALVMTNSQAVRTVPLGLALFRSDMPGVGWGEVMASALTAGLPAVVVFLVLQRQFIAGLTEGAVKG